MITNTTEQFIQPASTHFVLSDYTIRDAGFYGLLIILIMVAAVSFFRKSGENMANDLNKVFHPKKDKKMNELDETEIDILSQHLFFSLIEDNINVNIHNLTYICPLRRIVFTDALIFKMEALRDESLRLIHVDGYLDLPSDEFFHIWGQFENDVVHSWRSRCEDADIFPFVIECLAASYKNTIEIINNLIKTICSLTKPKLNNFEKTVMIFDILKTVHYTIMVNTLEDALSKMNGDFYEREYKGIKCQGEIGCVHCENINKHK